MFCILSFFSRNILKRPLSGPLVSDAGVDRVCGLRRARQCTGADVDLGVSGFRQLAHFAQFAPAAFIEKRLLLSLCLNLALQLVAGIL